MKNNPYFLSFVILFLLLFNFIVFLMLFAYATSEPPHTLKDYFSFSLKERKSLVEYENSYEHKEDNILYLTLSSEKEKELDQKINKKLLSSSLKIDLSPKSALYTGIYKPKGFRDTMTHFYNENDSSLSLEQKRKRDKVTQRLNDSYQVKQWYVNEATIFWLSWKLIMISEHSEDFLALSKEELDQEASLSFSCIYHSYFFPHKVEKEEEGESRKMAYETYARVLNLAIVDEKDKESYKNIFSNAKYDEHILTREEAFHYCNFRTKDY